jgi:hypothetical protein
LEIGCLKKNLDYVEQSLTSSLRQIANSAVTLDFSTSSFGGICFLDAYCWQYVQGCARFSHHLKACLLDGMGFYTAGGMLLTIPSRKTIYLHGSQKNAIRKYG